MLLSGDGHYVVCSMYTTVLVLDGYWVFFAMQHYILLSNTFKDTFSSLTCTMQCCIRVHVSGYYINSWISSRYTYRVIFDRASTKQEKLFWNFRLSANWTRDMKKGEILYYCYNLQCLFVFSFEFLALEVARSKIKKAAISKTNYCELYHT